MKSDCGMILAGVDGHRQASEKISSTENFHLLAERQQNRS